MIASVQSHTELEPIEVLGGTVYACGSRANPQPEQD
jgi:hypothetical protein